MDEGGIELDVPLIIMEEITEALDDTVEEVPDEDVATPLELDVTPSKNASTAASTPSPGAVP